MSGELQVKRGIWASVPNRVRLLILSQVLNGFAFGFFTIYITSFLPSQGIAPSTVSLVLGVEGFSMLIAGIPFAMLSDRKGRKWFIVIGNALLAPTIMVFALTRNIGLYFVVAAVTGLGQAMGLSSWNAMIADQTDLSNRDAAFSLSFITGTVSSSVGSALPLAFPAIEAAAGVGPVGVHVWALLLLGVANFASPLLCWVLLRNYREKPPVKWQRGLKLGGMGQTIRFSLINSIVGLGAGLIIPLLPLWLLLKFSVPDTYSGPYIALSGLTMGLAAVLSPRMSKKMGLFQAILTTQISSTVFMFSLAFIPNVYLAGGVYIVRAALMNMNSPLMDSFLMGITPPQRRGLASTLSAMIWMVPNTGSTIVGGFILGSTLYNVPFLGLSHLDLPWVLAAGFYVVGTVLLFVNFRHVKPNA